MVEPSALADTVTPASFSPVAETTVPLSCWSAAGQATEVINPLVMTAATPNMKCLGFMELLLGAPDSSACAGAALASGGRGGRYGFQIRNDGVDLRTLQIVLEPRHARGSLADETANDLVIAAGGFLRERRTIGAGVDRGRQMTDPARLREDLPAVLLGGIEPAGRLLSQGARTGE